MLIKVVKQFTFDCAHRITGHEGQCDNIHGHTYKLEVCIASESMSSDMVVDFGAIKKLVKTLIVDKFDHSLVLWEDGDEYDKFLLNNHKKVVKMINKTTAENMLKEMYALLHTEFTIRYDPTQVWIYFMRLWETPTSYAELLIGKRKLIGE
jgi:6-pyruvoyltetrahydropterin/6-carboxytetrahydropterin synthase